MDKRKRIVIITLCLLIIVGFITFFFLFNKPKKEDKLVIKKSLQISLGDEIKNIKDYVDKKDLDKVKKLKINWEDSLKIENNIPLNYGTFNGYFTYKNNEYKVQLVIIDDIDPVIDGVKNISIIQGTNIDLLKNISVSDNSNDELKVEVIGDYNINVVEKYNLKYYVKDNSGNECEKEFVLTVTEKNEEKKENNKNISTTTSKGYTIESRNGNYYIEGILIANKTFSLSSSYNPNGLMDVFNSNFKLLQSAAKNDGFDLKVISGFRSYSKQQSTYNGWVNKYGQAKADTLSARPGHSEHQTGLAADINSLNQSWGNTNEGKWLNNNCYKYGFIIRYPYGKDDITGYIYEPWHIRYVGIDLAEKLYNNGNWITLEEYFGIDSKY